MKNPLNVIEQATALDKPGEVIGDVATKLIAQGPLKDALTGKWQGHPVHPALTDIPIGLWLNSLVLDILGGERSRDAADRLLGLGILSSLPTAAAGLADWVDTIGDERRIGLVHAGGNVLAIALYTSSYAARKSGKRATGFLLSLAGTGVLTAAGFLGGHLVYRMGSGVNQTRFQHYPEEWTPVLPAAELPQKVAVAADTDEGKVFLYRDGESICAIADRCSHRGGPLHEGEIDPASNTVTCPWHASVFDIRTGEVRRGPASAPQPSFEARIAGDQVEVKLRQPE